MKKLHKSAGIREDFTDSLGRVSKLRSQLEKKFAVILEDSDVVWDYEVTKIKYTVPASDHTYTVDFTILGKDKKKVLLCEGKGILKDHQERLKYILIKEQHPELDLRFVFANPQKLCMGTKTTHAQWATKYGFKYCGINDTEQINSWLKELDNV
jgi:hypothetical protein